MRGRVREETGKEKQGNAQQRDTVERFVKASKTRRGKREAMLVRKKSANAVAHDTPRKTLVRTSML